MAERGHRLVAHTADTGIEAWGATLDAAFEEAALGLSEIMIDPSAVEERVAHRIAIHGEGDDGDLLVRWLNELVYLVDARGLVFHRFVVELRPRALAATAYGEPLDLTRHQPRSAVKAATYHQVAVDPGPPARVRVIVDL